MTPLAEHLLQKNRVLLFDFDGSLFDTATLKQAISAQLTHYTTNADLLWQTEKRLRSERYHLVETMRQFCEQAGIPEIQHTIQEIFLNQDFKQFVFPDVIETLTTLRQDSIIALFSEGDETYQQVKIYQSEINKLCDFLYIYHRKLQYLAEVLNFFNGKEIWLIDNQLPKLEKAKKHFSQLKTVWLNREQLVKPVEFEPDVTISTLKNLFVL